MKILITGCTAIMANSPRKQTDIVTSLPCLKSTLEDLGHTVDWRGVTVGEDLSKYDLAVISLAPLSNWGTGYMGGALWALMSHENIRLTVDDWQTRGIHKSAQGLIKQDKYFQKIIWGHWKGKVDDKYEEILKDAVKCLSFNYWPFKTLVPAWDGGNLGVLNLPSPLTNWDPTRYMRNYDFVGPPLHPDNKVKRWIFASLTSKLDWLNKQNFKWPVTRYGNVREGQQKLEEHALVRVYRDSWGVLSPLHNVSAAGWWRVRFWLAATSNCVMACEKSESRILGKSFDVIPTEVEKLSVEGLTDLAHRQFTDLDKITWQKSRVQEVIEEFIK